MSEIKPTCQRCGSSSGEVFQFLDMEKTVGHSRPTECVAALKMDLIAARTEPFIATDEKHVCRACGSMYGELHSYQDIPGVLAHRSPAECQDAAKIELNRLRAAVPGTQDSRVLFEGYMVLGVNERPSKTLDVLGSTYEIYPELEDAHMLARFLKRKLLKVRVHAVK